MRIYRHEIIYLEKGFESSITRSMTVNAVCHQQTLYRWTGFSGISIYSRHVHVLLHPLLNPSWVQTFLSHLLTYSTHGIKQTCFFFFFLLNMIYSNSTFLQIYFVCSFSSVKRRGQIEALYHFFSSKTLGHQEKFLLDSLLSGSFTGQTWL